MAGAIGVQFLTQLLLIMPLLIVWLVGLALGASLWSRRRAVAALLVAGCLVALVTDIFGVGVTSLASYLIGVRGLRAAQLGFIFAAVGLLRGLLTAVAWGLLLAAIWRAVGPGAREGAAGE